MPAAKSKNKTSYFKKPVIFITTLGLFATLLNMSVWAINQNQIKIVKESLAASPSKEQNLNLEDERRFWKDLTIKHPSFKWSYLRLAEIAKLEGNLIEYSEYKQKAFEIDPN